MTEDDLKQFLADNKADIQDAVKRAAIDRLIAQHSWNISEQIRQAVNDFIAKEVIPDVQAHLSEYKGALVSGVIAGLSTLSDDLAKGLATDAAKTIGDSWQRQKIIKALFNI
jgi:hypothetical protein